MATSPPIVQYNDTNDKEHTYSRKQKSLGRLCSNFLSLYNRDGVESVGVDDAANKLGVERRRIYDIVNVLESVGVLSKKAKNQYNWNGFKAIPKALAALKEEGLRDTLSFSDGNVREKFDYDEDTDSNPDTGSQQEYSNTSKPSAPVKMENRKEKSLGLLTRNFVKLFICSYADMISLDDAAKVLLGNGHNSVVMRTKVRRLYDIANVLSSLGLIEKTQQPETRKPAFRWLGPRERTDYNAPGPATSTENKKRTFGTEITNISFKRNRIDFPLDEVAKRNKAEMKYENKENESYNDIHSEQDLQPSSRNYHFGPFAPVTVAKAGVVEKDKARSVHDVESLASTYRPRYTNQAVRGIFDHYKEAWTSWHSEVEGNNSQE